MEIPKEYRIQNKIWIEPDMYYSEAFQCLSASALKTLLRCLQKRKWETGKVKGKKKIVYKNDGFLFPYEEMIALFDIGETTCWKNIIKLVEVGFLDIVHQGGWYQKYEKNKDFSVYINSDRWRKYGTPEFIKVEKPKILQQHLHIRENIRRKELKATSQKRSQQLQKSEVEKPKTCDYRLQKSEADRTDGKNDESIVALG